MDIKIKALELAKDMAEIEEVQRRVWEGSETEVVPAHLLVAIVKNGGLVIGAFIDEGGTEKCIGFVFGFPGFYFTPDGPRPMHCSEMLAVLPDYRDQGLGFVLKRAQWQIVRNQGLDRIIWTFDPLMSRNAHLNINKLGAVCNTYLRNFYGDMRDSINLGMESDRFQVDWWVNTNRVRNRLSREARKPLKLDDYLSGGVQVVNPATLDSSGLPYPTPVLSNIIESEHSISPNEEENHPPAMLLVEIPADFPSLKKANPTLAKEWREHTRLIFETLFEKEYLVTDLVHSEGSPGRSFYVASYGKSTL